MRSPSSNNKSVFEAVRREAGGLSTFHLLGVIIFCRQETDVFFYLIFVEMGLSRLLVLPFFDSFFFDVFQQFTGRHPLYSSIGGTLNYFFIAQGFLFQHAPFGKRQSVMQFSTQFLSFFI